VSQQPDLDIVGPPRLLESRPLRAGLFAEFVGREVVRALLALAALLLVCGTIYLAYRASQQHQWTAAKQWLQVVLPAEMGILGSVLGFYFGAHQSDRSHRG
jgi:hypothetical protein